MSMRVVWSPFVRRVPVRVTGFPNPATNLTLFTPGGGRRDGAGIKIPF